MTVEGQISTPPLADAAAIHFPFGSNATSRRLVGRDSKDRGPAPGGRPERHTIQIFGGEPTPGWLEHGPGRRCRRRRGRAPSVRRPAVPSDPTSVVLAARTAATSQWPMESNATPLTVSPGRADAPVSCRGSRDCASDATCSPPASSSSAIRSPLPASQKLETGARVLSTIRCPAAPSFSVDANT